MLYWALALLIFGMIFAIVEIFVPGFGFFGITGIVLFILSWVVTIFYIPYGVYIVLIEAIILITSGFMLYNFISRKNIRGTIILDEPLGEDKKEDYSILVGKEGIAKTSLKPFGKADFNGVTVDVCGESFIEKGKRIKAVKCNDGKLYVVLMN
jgi:membrane-bound serine protease (ClpP class)